MSLNKAIEHGKEKRDPVISPDSWCRNNGGCSWCLSNRMHSTRKRELIAEEKLKEAEAEMNCKVKCARKKRKTIHTERLLLREMTRDDFADYFNHLIEADEVLFQYGMEPPEEQLEEFVIMFPEVLYYSIVEKVSGKTVGYMEVFEENDNLGFYIFKEFRRMGYCSEALVRFARAYLSGEMTGRAHKTIVAETLYQNTASIKLLEKAGFRREEVGCRFSFSEEGDFLNQINLIRYVLSE